MSKKTDLPPKKGAVLTISKIINSVMSSAAETEQGALFINCKEAIRAIQTLEEMGHTKPPKQIQIENTTSHGVVTNNIYSKGLKSMDMRLY